MAKEAAASERELIGFRVSHPSRDLPELFGVKVADTPAKSVELFRAKHGKVNSVHPYKVTYGYSEGGVKSDGETIDVVPPPHNPDKRTEAAK